MTMSVVDDRYSLARWLVCAVVVVGIHGAVAAAMISWQDTDDMAEPSAALVIDLAPFPVTPPASVTELPPGPEQVEAEASPQVRVQEVKEQIEEEKPDTEQTQDTPAEVAPALNPEVVLAALPPKPEQQIETPQENQLPAPETTAPQVLPFELAEVAAAPVQGVTIVENSNAIPTWRTAVVALLERNKRYPASARDARGVAQVAFSIDRQGRVTGSQILASSGSAVLDREALELIRRAQPFPSPPSAIGGSEIRLTVPVRFNMR